MDIIAETYPKAHYYLTGHSKGGNLAIYAGFYVEPFVQNKIVRIYNFDGPGFEKDDIDQEKYFRVKNKIKTVVPANSIIGMIFEQLGSFKAVKSLVKPIYQHDGFMWEVDCNRFARTTISKTSSQFSEDLNNLVAQLNEEERRSFCNSLEKYIDELGIKTLTEALSLKTKSIKALKVFTKKDREIFINFVKILIKNGIIR
jgi:RecG-like helicase